MTPEAVYLKKQLRHHYRLFFTEEIYSISESLDFVTYEQALETREHKIVIPVDLSQELLDSEIYKVAFNNTEITLYNRIKNPNSAEWKALPNDQTPVWYQHISGTVIPAYDLFGNLFSLLSSSLLNP